MDMSSKEHEQGFECLKKTLDHFFINIQAYRHLLQEIGREERNRIINATDASTPEDRERLSRDRERLARHKERVARASIKMKAYLQNQKEEADDALDVFSGALYHAKDVLRKELVLRNKDALLSGSNPVQAQNIAVNSASHLSEITTTNGTDDGLNDLIMTLDESPSKSADAQVMQDISMDMHPESPQPPSNPKLEVPAGQEPPNSNSVAQSGDPSNVNLEKPTQNSESAKQNEAESAAATTNGPAQPKEASNPLLNNISSGPDQTANTSTIDLTNTSTAPENPSPGDLLPGLEQYANDPAKDFGHGNEFPTLDTGDQNTDNFFASGGDFDFGAGTGDLFGQDNNLMDTNFEDLIQFDFDNDDTAAGSGKNDNNNNTQNGLDLAQFDADFFDLPPE